MMIWGRSQTLLALGLVATLAAAWFAPPESDDALVLAERGQPRAQEGGRSTSSLQVEAGQGLVLQIHPRSTDDDQNLGERLFLASGGQPPKPVPVSTPTNLPPPAPQAPPLPFQVLGRYEEAGQTAVFLQFNDQALVVREGDTLGELYKVEKLTGSSLSMRYLPLNQLQSLEIGSSR